MPKVYPLVAAALLLGACGQDGIATTTGGSTSSTTSASGGGATGGFGAGGGGGAGGSGGIHTGGAGGAGGAGGVSTSSSTSSANGGNGGAGQSSSTTTTTTASSSGSGGNGTGGGTVCLNAGGPTIAQAGTSGFLLRGTIVDSDPTIDPFVGEVLVTGDTIQCVQASCAGAPGAANATIIATNGMVMPGLIDAHNHILFDIFDETDWTPMHPYGNHNQWTSEARYSALVDCKQFLNGEGTAVDDLGCEMDKYGELKAIVAGTTSVVGAANPANKKCYGSLARTIDQSSNGLPADKIQAATLFPDTTAADGVCANFASGKTDAYVIHDGEGVDQTALNEFAKLGTITTTDNCLYAPKTTVVHGTAFGDPEFTTMGANGMSLVWSPRSNVFLYGGGTDLTKTANVPLALSKGVNVALAPDWSIGGSANLLDELRFAKRVGDTIWGGQLTTRALFGMVTWNAAKALGLGATIGSIAVGKKADLTVISGNVAAPYDALLAATPREVRLVLVGGTVLYGDASLQSLGPQNPGCEALDVCCTDKFVCVAETATNDKLNETFADIRAALVSGLADYDAMNLTQWSFSPIAPLVVCQ